MPTHAIDTLMQSSGVTFGTSGARGLATAMTDEVCYSYTKAFIQHLESEKAIADGSAVAIAGDRRPSSPRICAAVAKAVEACGYTPLYCGEIPSPAVAYYGLIKEIPSVMVTGSHIPDDRNGIKYNSPQGEIMKKDEEGIRAQSVEFSDDLFGSDGMLSQPYSLPAIDAEAEEAYIKRYTDFFDKDILSGLHVGLYQHSCVGRDVLNKIYSELGAVVTCLGRSETFIPVDTEAIRPEDVTLAKEWAAGGDYDALLSADGDCDRPLISDEMGNWLRGDVAGILCAQHIGADAVITPVSCNSAAELCGSFDNVTRTRIGSPFVIAAMNEASAAGASMVVGYEANGGFLTNTPMDYKGGELRALPTRDAVILHIAILAETKIKGCQVSDLLKALPARYTASNRLKEFPTDKSQAKIATFNSGDFASDAAAFEAAFGDLCGKVTTIDTTDGVRATFDSGEIVHLRPSGNAPELRCYNEAADEARVIELNSACIARMEEWRN